MKTRRELLPAPACSLESDLLVAVHSIMGRLRLKEMALYAGPSRRLGTFRFRENRLRFYPAASARSAPPELGPKTGAEPLDFAS